MPELERTGLTGARGMLVQLPALMSEVRLEHPAPVKRGRAAQRIGIEGSSHGYR